MEKKKFIEEFEKRKQEVNIYFDFLKSQINKEISFKQTEVERILKANSLLILYNLIESSIRNAIQAIHDTIQMEAVSYYFLKEELQRIYLRQLSYRLQKSNHLTFESLIMPFLEKIIDNVFIEFDKTLTFGGNLDAQKIREIAKNYGFSSSTLKANQGGRELLTVKTQRNNLAHGIISFSECGRDHSFPELDKIKEEIINYIEDILNNIEDYIDQQAYKKSVP